MKPEEFKHRIKGPRDSNLFSYNELLEFAEAYGKKCFDEGEEWGTTHAGWFAPTKEDHEKRWKDFLNSKE